MAAIKKFTILEKCKALFSKCYAVPDREAHEWSENRTETYLCDGESEDDPVELTREISQCLKCGILEDDLLFTGIEAELYNIEKHEE